MTLTNQVLTAYCCCTLCTKGLGLTAVGRKPIAGITIAAPRSIPLGTKVQVGTSWYVAEDRLSKRLPQNVWDIFFDQHKDAKRFGRKVGVTIYVQENH